MERQIIPSSERAAPHIHTAPAWLQLSSWLQRNDGLVQLVDGPGSALEHVFKQLGVRVTRIASWELIERFGTWVERSVQDPLRFAMSIRCISDLTGHLEIVPALGAGLRASKEREIVGTVTLDRWLQEGWESPAAIVFNDGQAFTEFVRIAAMLHETIPVVMVASDVPGVSAVEGKLREAGYDRAGTPKVHPESRHLLFSAGGLRRQWESGSTLLPEVAIDPGSQPVSEAWMGLASGAKRFVPVDIASVPSQNFYPPEREGATVWRWTGPKAVTTLLLPQPVEPVDRLRVRFFATASCYDARQCKALVSGRLVTFDLNPAAFVEWAIPLAPGDFQRGWLELKIVLPYTDRPNPEDPRWLGVAIASMAFEGDRS